jgi:hypothetical protein
VSGRQHALFDAFPGGEGVSLDDQIAEVEREIRMRRDVYAGRLRRGLMREEQAVRQTETMLAVRRSLLALREAKAPAP